MWVQRLPCKSARRAGSTSTAFACSFLHRSPWHSIPSVYVRWLLWKSASGLFSLRLQNQFSVSSFGSCGTEIRHFNAPRRDVAFVCILHTMLCKHFCSHQNSKSDWIPKHRCLYGRCWLPFSCDRALGMHIMFRDTHEVSHDEYMFIQFLPIFFHFGLYHSSRVPAPQTPCYSCRPNVIEHSACGSCCLPSSCNRALGMHMLSRNTLAVLMRSGTPHAYVPCV